MSNFKMLSIGDDVRDFFKGVDGICEANTFEYMRLCQGNVGTWVGQPFSIGVTIARFGDMPVTISVTKATVNGKLIAFIEATSVVVHWGAIEEFLKEVAPNIKKTDAMNFHIIV